MEEHMKPLQQDNTNSILIGVLAAVLAIIITLGN